MFSKLLSRPSMFLPYELVPSPPLASPQKRLFNASRWLDRAGPGALELAKQMIAPEADAGC